MVIFIVVLILTIFGIIWLFKHRSPVNKSDTVIAFTGGLGAGKTAYAVNIAVQIYKRNYKMAKLKRQELPELYSNIPIQISKKKWSCNITNDITLIRKTIPKKSVVLIDEVGSYASQYDYKARNMEKFEEFVRFFRHYTHGGTLIVTDQCSENIVVQVRRRINTVNNLSGYRLIPIINLSLVYIRPISVSEEIKTVAQVNEDNPDGFKCVWFFGNPHKYYDSCCYDIRYQGERASKMYSASKKQQDLFKLEK